MSDHGLPRRCRDIELLVMDVDGVLTDGRIIYSDRGEELKAFHVRDGTGIKMWLRRGKHAAVVSGRTSTVVERRAAELGIRAVCQGTDEKLPVVENLLRETGIGWEQTACIGDDLADLPLFSRCGLAAAVADACPEAIAQAHYVTRAGGGQGAVREVIELILRHQHRWHATLPA
ncbi:MAG: HAD hydrolase family protein [Gemmataceae bacterium]|nr:HAD hydrolase family protein [Gemmataceae bacterium]